MAVRGASNEFAMNIPGAVYSWPLRSKKCICQMSTSVGELKSTFSLARAVVLLSLLAERQQQTWNDLATEQW
jgi:hypothetical protein